MNSTAPEVKVLNMSYLEISMEQKHFNIELVLQLMANHWSENKTYKVSLDQFIGLQVHRKHLLAQGWRTCPIQTWKPPYQNSSMLVNIRLIRNSSVGQSHLSTIARSAHQWPWIRIRWHQQAMVIEILLKSRSKCTKTAENFRSCWW